MTFNKKNVKVVVLILFSAILFWMLLQNLSSVWAFVMKAFAILSPIIIGLCLAFILSPLVSALEVGLFSKLTSKFPRGGKKAARGLSIVLSLIIVAGVIAAIVLLVIPEVEDAFGTIGETLPASIRNAIGSVNDLLEKLDLDFRLRTDIASDWAALFNTAKDYLSTAFETGILNDIANTAKSVISGFLNFFLGLVFSIYILAQREEICHFTRRCIRAFCRKKNADRIFDVSELSRSCFRNFVAGQLVEAVIIACLCFFGMLIFRFPYPTATSAVIGVTALIPMFGAWIGGILGALLALSDSLSKALLFIVFLIILQQLEGNLIYPKVVGKSMGLPGILVFVSVTLGASIGGVLGMLLGVPISAILFALIKRSVKQRLGDDSDLTSAPASADLAKTAVESPPKSD